MVFRHTRFPRYGIQAIDLPNHICHLFFSRQVSHCLCTTYISSLCVSGSKSSFLLGLVEFHRYLPHWGFLHDFAVLLRVLPGNRDLGRQISWQCYISSCIPQSIMTSWLSETWTGIYLTWVLLSIFPLRQSKTLTSWSLLPLSSDFSFSLEQWCQWPPNWHSLAHGPPFRKYMGKLS